MPLLCDFSYLSSNNNVDFAALADAAATASAAPRGARHMERVSMPGTVYF